MSLSSIIGWPKVFKIGKPDLSNNNLILGSWIGFPSLSKNIGLLFLSLIGFPSLPNNGFIPKGNELLLLSIILVFVLSPLFQGCFGVS